MRKFYYFRASSDDYGNMWVIGIFPHLDAFNWKGGKTRGLVLTRSSARVRAASGADPSGLEVPHT
jgi:hypothetical protein